MDTVMMSGVANILSSIFGQNCSDFLCLCYLLMAFFTPFMIVSACILYMVNVIFIVPNSINKLSKTVRKMDKLTQNK